MNAALVRRQVALAGVALVGALGAIALSQLGDESDAAAPPPAVVEWETASVGVFQPTAEPTTCGVTVTETTIGVAHPVLPCGAKILVEHEGRRTEADVIQSGPGRHRPGLRPVAGPRAGARGQRRGDGSLALRGIGLSAGALLR